MLVSASGAIQKLSLSRPRRIWQMNNKIICITFLIMIFIVVFILSTTGYGAVFNVTNPTEFKNALNTAKSNGEDDTINLSAGIYNVTTTLLYTSKENHALNILGTGAGSTILDGGSEIPILFT
jgi:hypothetical protein